MGLRKIYSLNGGFIMAVKKGDIKSANVMDAFFKGWSNNFDLFEEMEQKALQAIESQKEWIQATQDQFFQMEENSKKLTTEWKTNVQEILAKNQKELGGQNLSEWTDKLEEIGHKSQTLAFSPGKASLEILSNSHAQFEATFINSLNQQQKNRVELTKSLDSIVEQLKQTQLGAQKSFEIPVNIL